MTQGRMLPLKTSTIYSSTVYIQEKDFCAIVDVQSVCVVSQALSSGDSESLKSNTHFAPLPLPPLLLDFFAFASSSSSTASNSSATGLSSTLGAGLGAGVGDGFGAGTGLGLSAGLFSLATVTVFGCGSSETTLSLFGFSPLLFPPFFEIETFSSSSSRACHSSCAAAFPFPEGLPSFGLVFLGAGFLSTGFSSFPLGTTD